MIEQLADREEIRVLLARLGDWLDGQGGDPAEIYAPDIVGRGPRGPIRGLAEVVARVGPTSEEQTQHFHTDVVVDVDGDRAVARANQIGQAWRPGEPPHRTSGGRAVYQLTRGEQGWRIAEVEINLQWIIGDLPT